MKLKLKFMAALLTAALFTGFAAERNRLELPHLKKVPVLDGVISAGEWDDAAVFTGMQLTTARGLAAEQSRFYMKWDKNFIYVAAVCSDSNIKVVTAPPVLNWNDCLEFFMSAPGQLDVAHWLFYATGGSNLDFIDAEYGSGYRKCTDGVMSVPKINTKDWTIEARIPAASFYRDYFDSRAPFLFNAHRSFSKRGFVRSDGRPPEFSSFAKVSGQFLKPVDWAELYLNDESVAPVRLEKMDIRGMRLVCRDNVDVLLDFNDGRKITLRGNNGVFATDFPALCQGLRVRVLRDGCTIFSNQYDFHQKDEAAVKRLSDRQRAVSGLGVDVVDSMTRVFHQNPYCHQSSRIEISAARNEMENFQLVLFTGKDSVNQVQVKVSDFRTAEGAVLPASNVRLYRVGTAIADPCGYPTVNGPGEYPDPLYDLKPLKFKPMQVANVWASVKVPVNAKAGKYRGTVTVTAQGQIPREIAVTLNVWDFEIPKRQSLRTAFSIWEREIYRLYFEKQKRSADDFINTIDQYGSMAVEHRITPLIFKTPHLLPKDVAEKVTNVYQKQADGTYKVIPGKSDEITKRYLENGAL
ncbi:MAG: hypothetical protein J6S21_03205, partial [Victivallales bacterium]|nr:hypothetical protein [Victivallales bacterium]